MKHNIIKHFILCFFIIIVFNSCITEPKMGKYSNYTYGEIIKKHKNPIYDTIYIVDSNHKIYEIDPDYSLYFTKEELENGIEIREIGWENILQNKLIIWLKNKDGQWIAFDSLEYNSRFTKW